MPAISPSWRKNASASSMRLQLLWGPECLPAEGSRPESRAPDRLRCGSLWIAPSPSLLFSPAVDNKCAPEHTGEEGTYGHRDTPHLASGQPEALRRAAR